jgi:hypothetical protein
MVANARCVNDGRMKDLNNHIMTTEKYLSNRIEFLIEKVKEHDKALDNLSLPLIERDSYFHQSRTCGLIASELIVVRGYLKSETTEDVSGADTESKDLHAVNDIYDPCPMCRTKPRCKTHGCRDQRRGTFRF